MKDDCLFCKIANKEIDSLTLYEDDDILIILDAFPNVDGHTLVIPKKHYEDIYDVDDDTLLKMFKIGKEQAKKNMTKLNKKSLTFVINYGDAQKIKHIHLHLLPDYLEQNKPVYDKEEIHRILSEE